MIANFNGKVLNGNVQQISSTKKGLVMQWFPAVYIATSLGVLATTIEPKAVIAFEDGTTALVALSDLKIPA